MVSVSPGRANRPSWTVALAVLSRTKVMDWSNWVVSLGAVSG